MNTAKINEENDDDIFISTPTVHTYCKEETISTIDMNFDSEFERKKIIVIKLNYSDQGTWPLSITDSQRTYLVKMWCNYIEMHDFSNSKRYGKNVNSEWFYKKLLNCKKFKRTLRSYYSSSKNALYCVPYKLFTKIDDSRIMYSS